MTPILSNTAVLTAVVLAALLVLCVSLIVAFGVYGVIVVALLIGAVAYGLLVTAP